MVKLTVPEGVALGVTVTLAEDTAPEVNGAVEPEAATAAFAPAAATNGLSDRIGSERIESAGLDSCGL